jgi:processive 1,2-diacylglycerol beta-glucosyltransferase
MVDAKDDEPLVAVFHAEDPEALPPAEEVLAESGIDYLVRPSGSPFPVGFGHKAEFGGAEGGADIFVKAGDAAQARELLADLSAAPTAPVAASAPPAGRAPASTDPRPYRLTESGSGAIIGDITEAQLTSLRDQLEEESSTDRDYYIDEATIEVLEEAGADAELVAVLRRAVGSRDGVEIEWSRIA